MAFRVPVIERELGWRGFPTATFKGVDGDVADPTTITAYVRSPLGVRTDYVYGTDAEMTRVSLGVYRFSFVPDAPGLWQLTIKGSGAIVASVSLNVNISQTPAVPE